MPRASANAERAARNPESGTGEQLKLAGIERALRGDWSTRALSVIATMARSGRRFTGEDVVEAAGSPPSFRAVGAVINAAMRRGIIRTTGATIPARDPKKHRHRNLVWEACEPLQTKWPWGNRIEGSSNKRG